MKEFHAWRWFAFLCTLFVLTALSCAGDDAGQVDSVGSAQQSAILDPARTEPPAQPRAFALPEAPIVAGAKAGYLPGGGEVTPDGAYTYALPIELPPARGVQPSLSLAYSSRGEENGHLGVGFSLGGLSSIQRCYKTLASDDGKVDGIDKDSSDVFCLDGARLVNLRGTYGANGTEYRTEEESFVRVVSHGSPQPSSFRVWLKDGRIRDYEGVGPLDWRMTQEQDRSGNRVTYAYEELERGSNERGLTKILYGNQRIELRYQRRPDYATLYTAGEARNQSQRLASIAAYGPNPVEVGLLWRYELGYEESPDTGRSRLAEVKRCGGLGGCLMARRFTWSSRRGDWFQEVYSEEHPWFTEAHDPIVLDVDADGKDEVLFGTQDLVSPAMMLRSPPGRLPLSARDCATRIPTSATPFDGVALKYAKAVDVGGDGTSELFAFNERTRQFELYRWMGRAFEPIGMTVPISPDLTRTLPAGLRVVEPFHFVDVDGDGLADMIKLLDGTIDNVYKPTWVVRRNQPSGDFAFAYDTGLALSAETESLAFSSVALDAQGDGRGGLWTKGASQLMYPDDAGVFRLEDVPMDPFFLVGPLLPEDGTLVYTPLEAFMADLNGDGLRDRLLYQVHRASHGTRTALTVAWNTGKGFSVLGAPGDQSTTGHNLGISGYHPLYPATLQAADIDGDGREDILTSRNDPPEISVTQLLASPDNSKYNRSRSTTIAVPAARIQAVRTGDFDGDGLVDLVVFGQRCTGSREGATSTCSSGRKVGSVHVLLQQSTVIDVVTRVSDEGGAVAREQIGYARQWTDASDRPACRYPSVCQRRGMPVVRRHALPQTPSRQREKYFSYEDPRFDLWGRGFLGFGKFRVWEPQLPRETVTTFDLTTRMGTRYPFAHRPESVTVVTPIVADGIGGPGRKPSRATARVVRTNYQDQARDLNGGRTHVVFPHDWRTWTWEEEVAIGWKPTAGVHVTGIDGPGQSVLRTRYGSVQFDDWGALVSETRQTVGGVRATVTTTYEHREAEWLLGLPRRQEVTSFTPGRTRSTVRRTEFTWNAQGRIERVTSEPTGSADDRESVHYTYDAEGLVRSVTRRAADVLERRVHVEYDGTVGHVAPSLVWDDLGHAQWFAVHPGYGVVLAEMDANGVQTARIYDDLGRLVTRQPDGAAKQTWRYDQRENGVTVVRWDETGARGAVMLDIWGRPISVLQAGYDGIASFAETTYDVHGRVVSQSRLRRFAHREDKSTHWVYDSLGRLLRTVEPDGATTRYEHSFFETRGWDPRDSATKLVRDLDDRTVQSVSYLGTTELATVYEYGPFDQIEHITDPRSNVTTMGYDVRGRRTLLDDPDKGVTRSYYNGLGDLRRTEAAGQATVYERDRIGRAYRVTDMDGVTGYTWDSAPHGIGKLARTESPDGTRTETTYNAYGWPEEMTWTVRGELFKVRTSYDAAGRVDTLAYPEVPGTPRFTVKHSYNGSGELQQIKDVTTAEPVPLWFVDERSEEGALTRGTYGNGVQTVRTYNPVTGRLATQDENNGALLSSVQYRYYADGRVNWRNESVGSQREGYTYDALHRLTGWTLTAGSVTRATEYQYDDLGNPTRTLLGGVELERNEYLDPRPHALSANLGGSFSYDDRGRLHQGADRTIAYTNFDLPRQITTGAGTTRFDYDAAGVRVRKEGPDGGTTITIGGLYERRKTTTGTEHVFMVSGSDGLVAQVVVSEASAKRSLQFVHQDALGSITLVTDGAGGVLSRPYYEPFGKRIASTGTALSGPVGDVQRGLTGHDYDDELGLINLRGRILDPQLKRFLTPDPYVSDPLFGQSYNRYGYVLNDPVNRVDPTGYEDERGSSCGGCPPPQPPIVVQIPIGGTSGGSSSSGSTSDHHRPEAGSTRPPPIIKSDVDGASAQGAEPGSWKDSGVVQGVTGFLVGFGFGVLPGGGVVEATATAVGVMAEGTPEARLGKSLGEMVGGVVLTGMGIGGEAASWALSATGLGAVVGVPAVVVSAEAVTAGAVNIASGVSNLIQAMSTGAGSGGGTAATSVAARGGTRTEPKLPQKTIASSGEVQIEHYYRSGDHPPAHAHVKGGGETTRIGPNRKPLAGDPELSSAQQQAVDANKSSIRNAVNKIGRWLDYQEKK